MQTSPEKITLISSLGWVRSDYFQLGGCCHCLSWVGMLDEIKAQLSWRLEFGLWLSLVKNQIWKHSSKHYFQRIINSFWKSGIKNKVKIFWDKNIRKKIIKQLFSMFLFFLPLNVFILCQWTFFFFIVRLKLYQRVINLSLSLVNKSWISHEQVMSWLLSHEQAMCKSWTIHGKFMNKSCTCHEQVMNKSCTSDE